MTAYRKLSAPGLFAPARFLVLAAVLAIGLGGAASAQSLDERTATKIVWSTMAAVDHANRTGNYSVLRALGSPTFQQSNPPERLAEIFAGVRNRRLDLAETLMVEPDFTLPTAVDETGMMRLRGMFEMRPTAVGFDIYMEQVDGAWRIYGVAVAPFDMNEPRDESAQD